VEKKKKTSIIEFKLSFLQARAISSGLGSITLFSLGTFLPLSMDLS